MSKYFQFIYKHIDEAKKRLQEQLDALHTKEERQRVLTRYYSIIRPYFKQLRALDRSLPASAPSADSEIDLLEAFMRQLRIAACLNDRKELEPIMQRIIAPVSRSLAPRRPAAIHMANFLMAELASVYLPWMQILAADEGSPDTQFAQTDAAINRERALLAEEALKKEFDLSDPSDIIDVNEMHDEVSLLFWFIFSA